MNWEAIPQQGEWEIVNSLGKDLSLKINCPVRYLEAHFDKPVFECRCSKTFPKFAVQAAQYKDNWTDIINRHNEILGDCIE